MYITNDINVIFFSRSKEGTAISTVFSSFSAWSKGSCARRPRSRKSTQPSYMDPLSPVSAFCKFHMKWNFKLRQTRIKLEHRDFHRCLDGIYSYIYIYIITISVLVDLQLREAWTPRAIYSIPPAGAAAEELNLKVIHDEPLLCRNWSLL